LSGASLAQPDIEIVRQLGVHDVVGVRRVGDAQIDATVGDLRQRRRRLVEQQDVGGVVE
jgi:hypothetical protein